MAPLASPLSGRSCYRVWVCRLAPRQCCPPGPASAPAALRVVLAVLRCFLEWQFAGSLMDAGGRLDVSSWSFLYRVSLWHPTVTASHRTFRTPQPQLPHRERSDGLPIATTRNVKDDLA